MPSCGQCPEGWYGRQERPYISCVSCPRGTWGNVRVARNLSAGCRNCPSGRYSNDFGLAFTSNNAIACKACPDGRWSSAVRVEKEASCISCRAGRFDSSGDDGGSNSSANCLACAAGRFSETVGAQIIDTCLACPSGFAQSSTGRAYCLPCTPGTKQPDEGTSACLPCGPSEFTPNRSMLSCLPCPIGRSTRGKLGSASCESCERGEFWSDGTCVNCNQGQYRGKDDSPSSCLLCPAGYVNDADGSSSCSVIPPGSHSVWINTSQESQRVETFQACAPGHRCLGANFSNEPCRAGYYTPSNGSVVCISCPPGTFSSSTGANECDVCQKPLYGPNIGAVSCENCSSGRFVQEHGQSLCQQCPPGRAYNASLNSCQDCEPGSYSGNVDSPCEECLPGMYSGAARSQLCLPCIPGTFTASTGETACSVCIAPLFGPNVSASRCIECPRGKHVDGKNGSPACSSCSAGTTYSETSGLCRACAPGQFNGVSGRDCRDCPAGYFAYAIEAQLCFGCLPGRYSNMTGSLDCHDCHSGRYSSEASARLCFDCEQGKFAPTNRSSTCTACIPGNYQSEEGKEACIKCPRGKNTFDLFEAVACDGCVAGQFANKTGSAVCSECIPGQNQPIPGQALCLKCVPGLHTNERAGATSCEGCSSGRYSQFYGSANCAPCAAGRSAEPGQPLCRFCPRGYFSEQEQMICNICPAGYSQKNTQQALCLAVEPGFKAANCTNVSATGAGQGCQATVQCPKGRYGDPILELRTSCRECPAGKSSIFGATRCDRCEAGYFAATPGTAPCTRCDFSKGRYQDQSEQTVCKQCKETELSPSGQTCVTRSRNEEAKPTLVSVRTKFGAENDHIMVIHWLPATSLASPSETRRLAGATGILEGFILFSSPDKNDFELNSTGQVRSWNFGPDEYSAIIETRNPLWEEVVYVQVQSIYRLDEYHVQLSGYSSRSNEWQVAKSCDYVNAYLLTASPSLETWQCRECPNSGVDCTGFVPHTQLTILPGYERISWHWDPFAQGGDCRSCDPIVKDTEMCEMTTTCIDWSPAVPDLAVRSCPKAFACLGGSLVRRRNGSSSSSLVTMQPGTMNASHGEIVTCATGFTGPLCQICDSGYGLSLGQCMPCDQTSTLIRMAILLCVLVVCVVVFIKTKHWREHIKANMTREDEKHVGYIAATLVRMIKINIDFLQVNSSATSVIKVEWPVVFQQFTALLDFINIDFVALTGATCVKGMNFNARFFAMSMLPILAFAYGARVYINGKYCSQRDKHEHQRLSDEEQLRALGESAFLQADRNGDGSIDAKELSILFKDLGYRVSTDEAMKIAWRVNGTSEQIDGKGLLKRKSSLWNMLQNSEISKSRFIELFCDPEFSRALLSTRSDEVPKKAEKSASKEAHADKKQKRRRSRRLSAAFHSKQRSVITTQGTFDLKELRKWKQHRQLLRASLNKTTVALFLVHTPVSKKVFEFFNCDYLFGRAFMRADYTLQCHSDPAWINFSPYVVAVGLGFTLGLPLMISVYLWRQRDRLQSPTMKEQIGFLYECVLVIFCCWFHAP